MCVSFSSCWDTTVQGKCKEKSSQWVCVGKCFCPGALLQTVIEAEIKTESPGHCGACGEKGPFYYLSLHTHTNTRTRRRTFGVSSTECMVILLRVEMLHPTDTGRWSVKGKGFKIPFLLVTSICRTFYVVLVLVCGALSQILYVFSTHTRVWLFAFQSIWDECMWQWLTFNVFLLIHLHGKMFLM